MKPPGRPNPLPKPPPKSAGSGGAACGGAEEAPTANVFRRKARDVRELADDGEPEHRRRLHREHQWLRLRDDLGAVFCVGEVLPFGDERQKELRERERPLDFALEGLGPRGREKAVGVVLGRQQNEVRALKIRNDGKRRFERPARGLAAGGVAVEGKVDRIGRLEETTHVLGRDRGAQGRHGLPEARLRELDHVHVALADDRAAALADVVARFEEPVEFAPLVVDGGLGGVQVLRLLVAFERARAEADHEALHVPDREHQTVAEGVVAAAVLFVDETGGEKLAALILVAEDGLQPMPPLGRDAQREARGRLPADPAGLEVFDPLLAMAQLRRVEVGCVLHEVGQGLRAFALRSRPGRAVPRDVHPVDPGELLDVFGEFEMLHLHDEADRIARLAAAVALVELLLRIDR